MKIYELDKAVEAELDQFFNASVEDMKEAAKAAGKAAVKELKASSPGTKYPKGWKVYQENTRTGTNVTVYNDGYYMLAHLLEYGHPKTGGGRVPGKVHIQPAEKTAMNTFEQELTRRINDA